MPNLPEESLVLFRRMISSTLNNWPSFQVSVEAGMGGPQTTEKLLWMAEVLEELFTSNTLMITPSDVEDFLCEILDNEFDTVIQDGTMEMVCASLCTAFQQICAGNLAAVNEKIETLVRNGEKQQQERASRKAEDNVQMDVEETSEETSSEQQKIDQQEEDDGWVKVRSTRRH